MPSLNQVQKYWNENVANWKVASGFLVGSTEFFAEVERYRFEKLNYLPLHIDYSAYQGRSVLDVGCGLSTDLSKFAVGGATVTGIDISQTAIKFSKKNFDQRQLSGEFHVMDGEQMEFADSTFDFVYCHTVLHFTPDPTQMISEIHRVLKPGGQALLMTINRRSWFYAMHRIAGVKIDYMDAPVFHRFDIRDFNNISSKFLKRRLVVERFPVRTEVHAGWKAFLYNTCFVGVYNSIPKKLIRNSGYHLLFFVRK